MATTLINIPTVDVNLEAPYNVRSYFNVSIIID